MTIKMMDFCKNCKTLRTYYLFTEQTKARVESVDFTYMKKKAVCASCNKPMSIPEFDDENIRQWAKARKAALRAAS